MIFTLVVVCCTRSKDETSQKVGLVQEHSAGKVLLNFCSCRCKQVIRCLGDDRVPKCEGEEALDFSHHYFWFNWHTNFAFPLNLCFLFSFYESVLKFCLLSLFKFGSRWNLYIMSLRLVFRLTPFVQKQVGFDTTLLVVFFFSPLNPSFLSSWGNCVCDERWVQKATKFTLVFFISTGLVCDFSVGVHPITSSK